MMTQPTVIFFGPDGILYNSDNCKIFLRTLLFSTAKKGQVLESLHVSIQRNESKQNFNIWVYGEKGDLKRGSGLFVPQEGVVYDHHFLLPKDGADFKFFEGKYKLIVYAKLVGKTQTMKLSTIDLYLSQSHAGELAKPNVGLFYDWGPDQQSYYAHIDTKPPADPRMNELYEAIWNKMISGKENSNAIPK